MNRERIIRRLGIVVRLAVLGATTCLLIATSSIPSTCDDLREPVAFQAEGTCGPGGLVVLDGANGSSLQLHNGAALGLPPLNRWSGSSIDPRVRPTSGYICPRVYERGDWEVLFPSCSAQTSGDGGVSTPDAANTGDGGPVPGDAGAPGPGNVPCTSSCQAKTSNTGQLIFTCIGRTGEPRCQSRLTVVP